MSDVIRNSLTGAIEWGAMQTRDEVNYEKAKTQAFFAQLAADIRKPHAGDQFRDLVRIVLTRATEAGLYVPETP